MSITYQSPLAPVFTNPELAPTAQFLYENITDSHYLTRGLALDIPWKGVRGSSQGDPKIMLSTISLFSHLRTDAELDLAFQVVRSQAQIIRNNIANQEDEFMLVYEATPHMGEEFIRFRSPRFADRILNSQVVAVLSEIDEIDERIFRDSFERVVLRYAKFQEPGDRESRLARLA